MSTNANEDRKSFIKEYEWTLRPCEMYKDEYKDCRSIKARLHQYFINGETIDCSQWKRDYDNCSKWTEKEDEKAAVEIIESELNRRNERLKGHYENNVWKKRTKPLDDWNKPLPEEFTKKYETSYLAIKAKELKGELVPDNNTEQKFCVIL